jgi:hypothetical protein
MKAILLNLAMIELGKFCRENNINCSGTYTVKAGRGFTYNYVDQATGQIIIASVTFHKSQVPTFTYNFDYRKVQQ